MPRPSPRSTAPAPGAESARAVRLADELEVLDHRWVREEGPHDRTPLREQRPLAEAHGVVFERVPEDHQQVALRVFDAPIDLPATIALGLRSDGRHPALDRFLERSLLAGWDADVGNFENHGRAFVHILQPRPGSARALTATPLYSLFLPTASRRNMSCTGLCEADSVNLPRGLSTVAVRIAAIMPSRLPKSPFTATRPAPKSCAAS